MDFKLSKTHLLQQEMYRKFAENEVVKKGNVKVGGFKIFFKCTHRFIKSYILKGGFRHGIRGLVYAVNDANYKFYTLIKIWEKQNKD